MRNGYDTRMLHKWKLKENGKNVRSKTNKVATENMAAASFEKLSELSDSSVMHRQSQTNVKPIIEFFQYSCLNLRILNLRI